MSRCRVEGSNIITFKYPHHFLYAYTTGHARTHARTHTSV